VKSIEGSLPMAALFSAYEDVRTMIKRISLKQIACSGFLFLFTLLLLSCTSGDKATGSASSGPGSAVSARPAGNAPPVVTTASIYPDNPGSEKQLIVHYSGSDPDGDLTQYTFRWYVDNSLVQDGPNGALEPGKIKGGSQVYVEIVPSDSFGPGQPLKTNTVTIKNLPPAVTFISLSPKDPSPGAIITATPAATDPDGDDIKYSYLWKVNGKAVTEPQESNTFDTKGLRKKDMVFAVVTPTDRKLEGKPMDSEIVVLANSGPQITSTPPTGLANGVYLYQVAAKDPDGDRLTYSLLKAPQGMTIDPSTGLIRWELPKEVQGKSDVPIKISVDDGDGGKALQEYSLTLEVK